MAAIREVSRLRRLARGERHLIDLYVEHNLTEQARAMRLSLLGHLRDACQNWRAALGIVPESALPKLAATAFRSVSTNA
jgi:membrane protein required for beta-lactamase induction